MHIKNYHFGIDLNLLSKSRDVNMAELDDAETGADECAD